MACVVEYPGHAPKWFFGRILCCSHLPIRSSATHALRSLEKPFDSEIGLHAFGIS